MKIYPITRSITVSKKIKGVWMTKENDTIEIYKNKRRILVISKKDLIRLLELINILK